MRTYVVILMPLILSGDFFNEVGQFVHSDE